MSDTPAEASGDDKRERPEQSASVVLDGPHGRYTVTASTLNLKDDKGEDRASVFSVAYVREQGASGGDPSRPVTFCFNGGPGSSSVWLQFGAFGPKRVAIPDEHTAPPPPNPLVDNAEGLLDLTDMVFIDPVGTGFSRSAGTAKDDEFHGVEPDVASVGEFIWRWLSRNGRWQSPKFLAGESYGTTRAGALVNHLAERGIACNGLVLLSLALNFQTFIEEPGNDLPYVLYLPTLAAVAHYHGVVGGDLDTLLDDARQFANNELAPALLQGVAVDPERKQALAKRLAAFTGLDAGEIARRNLRIPYLWFARTVLGSGPQTVGRLDGRFVGPDHDPTGTNMTRDPSYDAALPAYTAAVNDFLRREVGFDSSEPYEVLSMKVNQGWKWQKTQQTLGYPNTTADLQQALVANPHLHVLFANGLHDLATPFHAAEFTANHLRLHAGVGDRIRLTYYPAGHMMYFHPPSLVQLKSDLTAFYGDVTGADR